MPNTSDRQRLLRRIQQEIDDLAPAVILEPVRRRIQHLLVFRAEVKSTRYLERPSIYRGHALMLDNEYRFPQSVAAHKQLLRVTQSEFTRLIDIFGGDEVFLTTGKKPQAPVRLQMGVFLHRMAHGHDQVSVATRFGISSGDVTHFTDRCLIAINNKLAQFLSWPSPERREQIKLFYQRTFDIPDCVGFIDGTHINLDKAPSKSSVEAAAFHSRKERYGMLLLAVVDHSKRFTYLHHGFSARSSDMRAQRASRLHTNPEDHFSPGEYVLGDAGFLCTTNIIPMYRKHVGESELTGHRLYFNKKVAQARIDVEHAFGILKARWTILRSARLRMMSDRDDQRVILVMLACCVLHNLLIATARDFMEDEDYAEVLRDEDLFRREQANLARDEHLPEQVRRREELCRAMIELDPEAMDLAHM